MQRRQRPSASISSASKLHTQQALAALELMQAERGLIMLLDNDSELQVRTYHNIELEEIAGVEFRISNSITNQVVTTGKSILMTGNTPSTNVGFDLQAFAIKFC